LINQLNEFSNGADIKLLTITKRFAGSCLRFDLSGSKLKYWQDRGQPALVADLAENVTKGK
jgi:hypothetical protein